MPDPRRHAPLALQARRDKIVEQLCRHVADDTLSLEEFERRVDRAHRARTHAELEAVLDGLRPPAVPDRHPVDRPARETPAVDTAPDSDDAERRGSQFIAAIMGGAARKGRWVPARRTNVLAFMGGAELDFREARLPPGLTEINVFTVWGGIEIVVPPEVTVQVAGTAIMGGFEQIEDAPLDDELDETDERPVLRINGLALMGAVEVKTRFPGETERDARRRRREARRRLRDEARRELGA